MSRSTGMRPASRIHCTSSSRCTACGVCVEKCPVKVDSEFDQGETPAVEVEEVVVVEIGELEKIYFEGLDLRVPVGWHVLQSFDNPYFGNASDQGGWRTYPLVKSMSNGKMHRRVFSSWRNTSRDSMTRRPT